MKNPLILVSAHIKELLYRHVRRVADMDIVPRQQQYPDRDVEPDEDEGPRKGEDDSSGEDP
jgi:hypothetical protein